MGPFYLYEGVSISNTGEIFFNWKEQNENDIIALDNNTACLFDENDVRYVCGYKYLEKATAQQKKLFRDYIKKGPHSTDVEEFVEKSVIKLDEVQRLNSFGALVSIKSTSYPSIISVIGNYLRSYMTPSFLTFELIKQTYQNVTFNSELAFELLIKSGWDEVDTEDEINFLNNKFEALKKENGLFQMKRFIPTTIRGSFSNFLKFKNERQKQTYEKLQGIDVLIYYDFLTNSSTVKEIIRYLKAINPNNTLTVFVLVDQNP